jgi:hypothetical protein
VNQSSQSKKSLTRWGEGWPTAEDPLILPGRPGAEGFPECEYAFARESLTGRPDRPDITPAAAAEGP